MNILGSTSACFNIFYLSAWGYEYQRVSGLLSSQYRMTPIPYRAYILPFMSILHLLSSWYEIRTFSCAQVDLRKAREREFATLDEKSTSSGIAEPYAR